MAHFHHGTMFSPIKYFFFFFSFSRCVEAQQSCCLAALFFFSGYKVFSTGVKRLIPIWSLAKTTVWRKEKEKSKLTSALYKATESRRSTATLRNIWTKKKEGKRERKYGFMGKEWASDSVHPFSYHSYCQDKLVEKPNFSPLHYHFIFGLGNLLGKGVLVRISVGTQSSRIAEISRNLRSAEEFLPVRQSLLLLSSHPGQWKRLERRRGGGGGTMESV